ncbi:MAG: MoaD/ThiS family protein [Acidiferrobacterales bacterium]
MSISVKYFASVRDLVGKAEDAVDCGDIRSANDVWVQTTSVVMPPNTLVAINQEHARGGDRVRDGDEVAFLPPVTGG